MVVPVVEAECVPPKGMPVAKYGAGATGGVGEGTGAVAVVRAVAKDPSLPVEAFPDVEEMYDEENNGAEGTEEEFVVLLAAEADCAVEDASAVVEECSGTAGRG